MLVIELGSITNKASGLPTILSLWPLHIVYMLSLDNYFFFRNLRKVCQENPEFIFGNNVFTWCLCSPKLCTCHHTDPGLLRAPWLWCSLDPLYYVSVPVLYLCPHSLLCESFEQLIASVRKEEHVFLLISLPLDEKRKLMKESSMTDDKGSK